MKEKLHFFIENISANLFQKWTLYVHRNFLGKRNSDNFSIFQQFWTFNKKIGLLSKFFGAVVKTAFYVSLGPFWGKTFIEKTVIYNQFLTSSKTFWPFGKVSGWGCQKCNLCVCIRTFLGESEFWKDLHFCLYIFGHRDNFLAFHLKSFKAVVKTAFCVSSQHFEVTKIFLKKKWRRKKNLSIFEHWSKNLRLFNEIISTGFSKLHPTSAFETFWGRTFFGKSYLFDNPFRKLEEKFWELRQNFFGKAFTTAL